MKPHHPAPAAPSRPEPTTLLGQYRVSIMGAEVGLDELAEFQTRLRLGPAVFCAPGFPSSPRRTHGR